MRLRGRSNASFSLMQNVDLDDPLTRALQPPPNESVAERDERLRAEREAKRVSDEIDDELRRERAAFKKKQPVRVLLLGQSESGKSTTLKNFQIHFAPQSWHEERACWRIVIQLNLIRSVWLVLDTVAAAPPPTSAISITALLERYAPLRERLQVAQRILQRRLSPTDADEAGDYRSFAATDSSSAPKSRTNSLTRSATSPTQLSPSRQEFFVINSGASTWKSRFRNHTSITSSSPTPSTSPNSHGSPTYDKPQRTSIEFRGRDATPLQNGHFIDEPSSPTEILHAALPEMRALWQDKDIREALDEVSSNGTSGNRVKRWIRIEDTPGFFLNDVDRIASRGYEPSDDDVLHSRLPTMGVQEHRFIFERGLSTGQEWRVYDVGGARSQRTSWLSFFDEMDAIIFLAPISCFDEMLAEDRRVNRLEDSMTLWQTLCRSPLLTRVQLILFLNKVDLLRQKLANGARVARHVTSFGDRTNDLVTVCRYFKQKFKDIQRQYSPEERPYYVYLTSVTDTRATGVTLGLVREGILRSNLQRADFL